MNWVTFVGEGRSGHTVISGALGSHPHARISEEQKYISKWRREWSRDRILASLLEQGAGRTRARQGWTNLSTHTEPLLVMGDKCGWDAVNEVAKRNAPPTIIDEFGVFIGMPVKTLVTVRHPLDNIASWMSGDKYKRMYPDRKVLGKQMIKRYRRFHLTAVEIVQNTDHILVSHERLVESPSVVLQEISDYLELPPNRDWRRASAKRVWSKPRERRNQVQFLDGELEEINRIIGSNPLLECYR
jgi:hypothetical protein